MSDNVNHPSHYGGEDNPYEVIKVMKAWLSPQEYIGAMKFNIHKYNARAGRKPGVSGLEDARKAEFYQRELVSFMKGLEQQFEKASPSQPKAKPRPAEEADEFDPKVQ